MPALACAQAGQEQVQTGLVGGHREMEQERNFLHMKDKKAEEEEEEEESHSSKTKQKQLLLQETTSLTSLNLLSGGFVYNLMAAANHVNNPDETQQRVVTVHHHHHIYHHHYSAPEPNHSHKTSSMTSDNFYINISRQLTINKYLLEQCGWYYGNISHQHSSQLLSQQAQGTFLVRDSAHSQFLYTLSVQRGLDESPTSVRIFFSHGNFRLDADTAAEHLLPKFNSILDLIEHYCSLNSQPNHTWIDDDQTLSSANVKPTSKSVVVDKQGKVYAPICLRKPLRKEVPSLAHAARLVVHQCLRKSKAHPLDLKLPNQITNYLTAYPHVM